MGSKTSWNKKMYVHTNVDDSNKFIHWLYHCFRIKDLVILFKVLCDCKCKKGSIFNSKCIEGRGRSRLGGKKVVRCAN